MKGIEDCLNEIIETTIMSKDAFAEKYPVEVEGVEEWIKNNSEEDG